MQKINLLPASFLARKKIAIAWTVVAALIAVEITGVVFGKMALSQQVGPLTQAVDLKEKAVADVGALKGEADQITQGSTIYEPTLKAMQDLKAYNQLRPALYQKTARYVYRNATTLSMNSGAGVLQLQMYVTNLSDLSRAYLYLWTDPDFSSVTLSAVPNFRTRAPRRSDDENLPPSFIPGFDPMMAQASPYGMPGDPYGGAGFGGPAFGAPGGSGAPASPYGAPYGAPGMPGEAGASPYGAPYGAPGAGMSGDPSMMAGGMPGDPTMGGGANPYGGAGYGAPATPGGGFPGGGFPGAGGSGAPGMPGMPGDTGAGAPYGPGAQGDPSMMAGGMPGMDALGGDPNAQGQGLVPGIAPWRLAPGNYPLGSTVVFTCYLKKPIQRPAIPGVGVPGTDPSGMGMPGGGMPGGGMPGDPGMAPPPDAVAPAAPPMPGPASG